MQWKYMLPSNYCDICHLTSHGRKYGGGGDRCTCPPHFLEGVGHNMKCPPPPPPHTHTHTFGGLGDFKLKLGPFSHVLWRCRPVLFLPVRKVCDVRCLWCTKIEPWQFYGCTLIIQGGPERMQRLWSLISRTSSIKTNLFFISTKWHHDH